MPLIAAAILLSGLSTFATHAQFIGPRTSNDFKDTSMLRPPAGAEVAIVVFEDLGCPGCAKAHPIEIQAAQQYHVPIVRYDFPIPAHIWTFDGAVCARYLEDKVSPKLAEQYRSDVFASQRLIDSKDDIQHYTQRWMQQHGQQMPFVLDPGGKLAAKVRADYELGLRLNVTWTPTVVVVTRNNYQIVCGTPALQDPLKLFPVLRAAIAQSSEVPKPQTAHPARH
jgi:protein-disulfide isomerase